MWVISLWSKWTISNSTMVSCDQMVSRSNLTTSLFCFIYKWNNLALFCPSLGQTTSDILAVAVKARSQTLGPLSPRFDLNTLLKERLENALPQDAHIRCSGRLFISVTRWTDKKNVLLSQFNTREELIQVRCSLRQFCFKAESAQNCNPFRRTMGDSTEHFRFKFFKECTIFNLICWLQRHLDRNYLISKVCMDDRFSKFCLLNN